MTNILNILLGGTGGKMVEDSLIPYSNEPESGHMIIRVKLRSGGKRFKQSLCIAKIVSKMFKLEILY